MGGYTYKKAIGIIKKWPTKIKKSHVRHIQKNTKGIGRTVADNIIEILETGNLLRLETMKSDEKVQVLMRLTEIWGVGDSTARKWYYKGVRTVEDVRNRADELKVSRHIR